METRYTYKIFTMDDANDIIHNSQSEIDYWNNTMTVTLFEREIQLFYP